MGEHRGLIGLACLAAASMACAAAPGLSIEPSPGQGRKSRAGRSHRTTPPPRVERRDKSESLQRMLRQARTGRR